jgi:hypothetical protein
MRTVVSLVSVSVCVGLAACGSDVPTDPSPNTVTSIVVFAQPTLRVGEKVTATAQLINSRGDTVAARTPSWSSSSATVATVDQTGQITAVGPGVATITARADKASDNVQISVDVDRCVTPLSLTVGQVSILSGPAAVSCITLGPSAVASQVLFITANGNSKPDDNQSFFVSLQSGTASSISPTASLVAGGMSAELRRMAQSFDERDRIENHIREAEGRIVRAMQRSPAASTSMDAAPNVAQASVLARTVAVGDTITYRVPDVLSANLCTTYATVRGVVKAVGQKAQIAVDVNSPTGLTAADLTAIATEFDDLIFKTDTAWFGSPTDINKDGRITILYTPEVNKFTKRGATSYIGGFFWGGDLFTKADYQAATPPINCPQTNEQEMFYLLTADPQGVFGDVRSTALVRQATRGTIAHEFQHMINQGIRQFNQNADPFEVDWLNEGLAHFAEEAVGRASRGFDDFKSLTTADVRTNADDYNAYFAQNLGRFGMYLAGPDTTSPISSSADRELPPRGAAWAMLRYAADQYSSGNARGFFRRLVAGPTSGVTNLVQRAGVPFDQILSGWMIANYTDNLVIAGLDARYSYTSWNMRDAVAGATQSGTYLLRVNTPTAVPSATKAQSGSGTYFLTQRPAGALAATFRMLATSTGGNVGFAGARVYVVRVN